MRLTKSSMNEKGKECPLTPGHRFSSKTMSQTHLGFLSGQNVGKNEPHPFIRPFQSNGLLWSTNNNIQGDVLPKRLC